MTERQRLQRRLEVAQRRWRWEDERTGRYSGSRRTRAVYVRRTSLETLGRRFVSELLFVLSAFAITALLMHL